MRIVIAMAACCCIVSQTSVAEDTKVCHLCKCLKQFGDVVFSDGAPEITVELIKQKMPECTIAELSEPKASRSVFIWGGEAIRTRIAEHEVSELKACHTQWQRLIRALRRGESSVCRFEDTEPVSEFAKAAVARCDEDQVITTQILPKPQQFAMERPDNCPSWPQPMAGWFLVMARTDNVHFLQANGFPANWGAMIKHLPGLDRVLWLMVQHADNSEDFQKSALERYQEILDKGDGNPVFYARLADRVAINEQDRQRFGTQWRCENRKAVAYPPVMEPETVDQRRAELGLPPLSEFLNDVSAQRCGGP